MKLQPIREELINNYPNDNKLIQKRDKSVKKHQKDKKVSRFIHLELINFKINNSRWINLDTFLSF